MSDSLRLIELNQFEDPGWMRDQTGLLSLTGNGCLQVWIPCFIQNYRDRQRQRAVDLRMSPEDQCEEVETYRWQGTDH